MPRHPISRRALATPLLTLLALGPAVPAHADGVILITQAKAVAGNVTSGDTAGYPVTLSRPGSYELAGNLAVPGASSGIQITAPDVTIDLNGFRIHGLGTANHGIEGTKKGATIRNGTIEHFKGDGIFVPGAYAIIADMRVLSNGRIGIEVGDDAHVRNSSGTQNGREGVACSGRCLVEGSAITLNGGDGILCGASCYAEGNLVSFNALHGISLYDGLALGNTVSRNGGYGIVGVLSTSVVYGDNVLTGNNQGGPQAFMVHSLHANFCDPNNCP